MAADDEARLADATTSPPAHVRLSVTASSTFSERIERSDARRRHKRRVLACWLGGTFALAFALMTTIVLLTVLYNAQKGDIYFNHNSSSPSLSSPSLSAPFSGPFTSTSSPSPSPFPSSSSTPGFPTFPAPAAPSRPSSSIGPSGPSSSIGPSGPSSSIGPSGPSGSSGWSGSTGPSGPSGIMTETSERGRNAPTPPSPSSAPTPPSPSSAPTPPSPSSAPTPPSPSSAPTPPSPSSGPSESPADLRHVAYYLITALLLIGVLSVILAVLFLKGKFRPCCPVKHSVEHSFSSSDPERPLEPIVPVVSISQDFTSASYKTAHENGGYTETPERRRAVKSSSECQQVGGLATDAATAAAVAAAIVQPT